MTLRELAALVVVGCCCLTVIAAAPKTEPAPTAAPLGTITGPSTMTAAQIDAVLAERGSPAQGTGAVWVEQGARYNLNPAYALAFFVHESGAGTASGWAGWKPDGSSTHNVGNIICAGYATCYGRFRDYATWDEGISDWFRLIDTEYISEGRVTVADIIPKYASATENNVDAYVQAVEAMVAGWNAEDKGQGDMVTSYQDTNTQDGAFVSSPLARDGFGVYTPACIEANVIGSLDQSPALQHITIAPGAAWSFNAAWTVDTGTLVSCYGVLGGSVCDMASKISQVAHGLGLKTDMTYHGFNLHDALPEDSTAIYGTPGKAGDQDLTIYNTTDQTVVIDAHLTETDLTYVGWFE